MALTNFFNINLTYWMSKKWDKWEVFNREYKILWWNNRDWWYDFNLSLQTEYSRLTDNFIMKHIPNKLINRDEDSWEICSFYFYDDWSNPGYDKKYWDEYSNKLRSFSQINKK